MPVRTQRDISAVQSEVLNLIRQSMPEDRGVLAEFLAVQCCADLYAGDGDILDPRTIYETVVSLLALMRHRDPHEIKLRVFNPNRPESNRSNDYTVIEIVNDDMPFLVDSIVAELLSRGCVIHCLLHPIVRVLRNKRNIVSAFVSDDENKESAKAGKEPQGHLESVIHIEIERRSNEHALDALSKKLMDILHDVRTVVDDWQPMRTRAQEVTAEFEELPPPISREHVDEYRAFFDWLRQKHFVFLGCRDYSVVEQGDGRIVLSIIPGSGLGILRDETRKIFEEILRQPMLPAQALFFLNKPEPLYLTKAGTLSSVHRRTRMDVVGVRCFDESGKVIRVRAIAGLYSSLAYSSMPGTIPVLREKVQHVLSQVDLRPDSHNGKALLHILQTFPRDELFLYSEDQLLKTVLGVMSIQQHRKAALFVRSDDFGRYVSCLVYVPRDGYDTTLRRAIADLLARAWSGVVENFHALVTDSPLARLHFIIKVPYGEIMTPPLEEMEEKIAVMSKPWSEGLIAALMHAYGEENGDYLARRYYNAFPVSFREDCTPEEALPHIMYAEKIFTGSSFELNLNRISPDTFTAFILDLYHPQTPIPLSDVLPVLERLGFRTVSERPYQIVFEHPAEAVWIQRLQLETEGRSIPHPETLCARLEEAFRQVWVGEAENDYFNSLILFAGLEWRAVVLLRAYAKYLRQIRVPFSQEIIIEALTVSPETSALLVKLFDARFNPEGKQDAGVVLREFEKSLHAIDDPDYDRVFRSLLNLIQFTLRTNFYQKKDGQPKSYISFKLDTRKLDNIPSPRPWVEVWVYSPRVEAVHLRAGKVARGGIRWSDHREDFRTEILKLMKPQIIKNAVAVSVGAKGGFVVKCPPVGREALLLEGIACYRTMVSGLLDITDNLDGDIVIPPPDVVRLDGDDPYLVVAAEKGTSSMSDIANEIALDYGYWLGDAFASSGSFGYNRRTIGITARGAWESAKRHFREMDIDAQSEDFTVVGVGDMSGDVFGNGMLRSPHIQLVAAFNHKYIFVDPNPLDTYASFNERLRLFQTPYSDWSDYDPSLISVGGGVFPRNAKGIPISPQMKERFDIRHDVLSSAELIKTLLRTQVNMLWFGGIGTYVKATTESDSSVDDRYNDMVRINAKELRCQVIIEGGSLGITQRGRIEYAQHGGRINIDSIDNSAGVDLSDHEVNIKILLRSVIAAGEMTQDERNQVFHATTDKVCDLVLKNNYLQTQQISSSEVRASALLGQHKRLLRSLEKSGRLNRLLMALPDEEEIAERQINGRGLTRPEIAVLLSYAKLDLFEKLVNSDFPEDPFLAQVLQNYFPSVLQDRYSSYMERHWLRREIIATCVSNDIINRCGIAIISQMEEQTGFSAPDIARAYVIACSTFDLPNVWEAIEAMDMMVSTETQLSLLHATERLLEQSIARILRRGHSYPLDIAACSHMYATHVSSLYATLPTLLSADLADTLQNSIYRMESLGTSTALARRIARFTFLSAIPDIADLCTLTAASTTDVARCYFNVACLFGLGILRENINRLFDGDHWQRLAATALSDDLIEIQHRLTRIALRDPSGLMAASRRYQQISAEFKTQSVLDLPTLMVACRQLSALAS